MYLWISRIHIHEIFSFTYISIVHMKHINLYFNDYFALCLIRLVIITVHSSQIFETIATTFQFESEQLQLCFMREKFVALCLKVQVLMAFVC